MLISASTDVSIFLDLLNSGKARHYKKRSVMIVSLLTYQTPATNEYDGLTQNDYGCLSVK